MNGWIILDKPLGLSSAHAVGCIKKIFKIKKAGHGGTLDPLATGILPIALGEATKTVPFIMDSNKTYHFEVVWGEHRTTDDLEGDVIETSPIRPSKEQILSILPQFIGKIDQIPPIYSALKVQGKRAYQLARAGEEVVLASRTIEIYSLTLLETKDDESALFSVHCSKGTYVRSLARDLGKALQTFGYVKTLRRVQSGKFAEKDAISLEKLRELVHNGDGLKALFPVGAVLDDIPAVSVSGDEVTYLRRGMKLPFNDNKENGLVSIWSEGTLIALGQVNAGFLEPKRIFHL